MSIGGQALGATGGAWFIPTGLHPLQIALDHIGKRPYVVDGRIEVREYLTVTVLSDNDVFDRDVADGAPVARFVQWLKEVVESVYGLSEEGR